MLQLKPNEAAELAQNIYVVQQDSQVPFFLKHSVFKKNDNSSLTPHSHLKAEVGGRVLNFKDGFGICAVGGDNNKNELFLIFRGTTFKNFGADLLTDARIGITGNSAGFPVHCGFQHCFSSMLPQIRQFINAQRIAVSAVHCIGHSLGGAIATLAADWIVRNTGFAVRLYTFGSPRVGTESFAKNCTKAIGAKNIYRVYHHTDPVSLVPLYPFMHAPYDCTNYFVSSQEPLITGAAHKIRKYVLSMSAKTAWEQLTDQPDQRYNITLMIENWLTSSAPADANSPTFWHWVDAALIYVLKKVALGALIAIQGVFVGCFTVADKIAYILSKGIKLAENMSIWVVRLMRKLMQALGMRVAKAKEELTQQLMKYVLTRLMEKANRDARDAIRRLR